MYLRGGVVTLATMRPWTRRAGSFLGMVWLLHGALAQAPYRTALLAQDPDQMDSTLQACRDGRPGRDIAGFISLAEAKGVRLDKRHPMVLMGPILDPVPENRNRQCRHWLYIGQYEGKRRTYLPGSNITCEVYQVLAIEPISEVVLWIEERSMSCSHKCHIRQLFGIDLHRRKRNIAF